MRFVVIHHNNVYNIKNIMNIDLEKFIGETIGGDAGKHPTFFQAPSPNTTGATTMDENGEPYVYDLQAFELDTAWETSNEGFRDRFTEVQHLTSSMPRFVLEGTVLSLADHFGEETVLAIINRFVVNGLIPDDNEIIEMLGPVYRNAMEIGFRKSLENEFENMLRLFHNAGGNEAARLLLGKIRRNMCKVTWHLYEEEVPPEENETYYLLVDILEKERDPFQIFDPNVPLPVIDKRRGGCSATSAGMLP